MHDLEPYYRWRDLYIASEDERSPFYQREYSEFEFTHQIYDHLIHPQWDDFGSHTLYMKVLFADYLEGYVIIELIGEWNDAINNDIMFFKRDIVEQMVENGLQKFILIGENVLNFHCSDDSYYEDWYNDLEDGWICFLNFRPHVLEEVRAGNLDYYINFGGDLDDFPWRRFNPKQLYERIEVLLARRLN